MDKICTSIEQSKKLIELGVDVNTADMYLWSSGKRYYIEAMDDGDFNEEEGHVRAWSLAALLEELNRNCWKVSLKCCGAEWDMTYDDGERYISVSSDYAIDACYEMIIKLHELKLL